MTSSPRFERDSSPARCLIEPHAPAAASLARRAGPRSAGR
jgi:hypothetical protein